MKNIFKSVALFSLLTTFLFSCSGDKTKDAKILPAVAATVTTAAVVTAVAAAATVTAVAAAPAAAAAEQDDQDDAGPEHRRGIAHHRQQRDALRQRPIGLARGQGAQQRARQERAQHRGHHQQQRRQRVDHGRRAVLDHAVDLERQSAGTKTCHKVGDHEVVDREGESQQPA